MGTLERVAATVDWSDPSPIEQNGVHSGYRRNRGHLPDGLLAEVGGSAWLSWIEPGGYIVPHRDAGPYRRRYQIPIRPAGWFWSPDGGWVRTLDPFDVEHWEPHGVVNTADTARVHLVVDTHETVVAERRSFETWPWPEDMPDDVRNLING